MTFVVDAVWGKEEEKVVSTKGGKLDEGEKMK